MNNTVTVRLSDNANGFVIANAVQLADPTLYWDPTQSDGADLGGSGTWSNNSSNKVWFDPDTNQDVAYVPGEDVIFDGNGYGGLIPESETSQTVTIVGQVDPGAMEFETDNYTIQPSDPSAQLNNSPVVGIWCDSATIYCNLSGNAPMVVDGDAYGSSASTLVLTGSNWSDIGGFTGGFEIDNANLVVGSNTALGYGNLSMNGGGLDLAGHSLFRVSLNGDSGSWITNNSSTPATLWVGDGGGRFDGSIADGSAGGVVSLRVSGGSFTMDGPNTYSGGTLVDDGATLQPMAYGGAMPLGSGGLTIGGATVDMAGWPLAIEGPLNCGPGACVTNSSGPPPTFFSPTAGICKAISKAACRCNWPAGRPGLQATLTWTAPAWRCRTAVGWTSPATRSRLVNSIPTPRAVLRTPPQPRRLSPGAGPTLPTGESARCR